MCCWWECKLIQPLWRTVWRFLKKLKIERSYDPAMPLLGIYPKKAIIQKETCITMFIATLFTIARTWKQPKCPSTDEWIKKIWHIYTMEYYSAIRKKRSWVICSEVDGPRVRPTEWSKSEREKQIPYANIYMESKKKNWFWWTQGQDIKKDAEVENGLEDKGRANGKLGQSGRVALTYIHYQI